MVPLPADSLDTWAAADLVVPPPWRQRMPALELGIAAWDWPDSHLQ
jgi:hypothetical protein